MTTATPAAKALKDVFALPIELVHPNPENPRRITDEHPSLAGMAQSMKELGQLQPIVARALPAGGWVIIAGERRWRAARMAGLPSIEAKVVDVDEQRAFEMTVVENLQRDDLHWLEEARGVETMTKRGWDVPTIAKHVGKSEAWVRLRAKLASISPAWRKAVEDPKSDFRGWPASMLELIARFPIETQEALLKGRTWELARCENTAALQKYLDAEVTRALKSAPWDLTDAKLVAKAGACNACPKRSSCQQHLFEEAKDDRCLDATCWKAKAEAHVVAAVTAAKKANPKVVVVGDYEAPKQLQKNLTTPWQVTEAKPDKKGAVPVIYASGEKAGQTGYAVVGRSGSYSSSSAKKSEPKKTGPKEQLAALLEKRAEKAVALLKEKLGGAKGSYQMKPAAPDVARPKVADLIMLATFHGLEGTELYSATVDPKAFEKHRALPEAKQLDLLWDGVRQRLVGVLEDANRDELATAGELVAKLIGHAWKYYADAARDALPLPKSLREHFDESGQPLKSLTAKAKPPAKPKAKAAAAKA